MLGVAGERDNVKLRRYRFGNDGRWVLPQNWKLWDSEVRPLRWQHALRSAWVSSLGGSPEDIPALSKPVQHWVLLCNVVCCLFWVGVVLRAVSKLGTVLYYYHVGLDECGIIRVRKLYWFKHNFVIKVIYNIDLLYPTGAYFVFLKRL